MRHIIINKIAGNKLSINDFSKNLEIEVETVKEDFKDKVIKMDNLKAAQ